MEGFLKFLVVVLVYFTYFSIDLAFDGLIVTILLLSNPYSPSTYSSPSLLILAYECLALTMIDNGLADSANSSSS
jgi:hypothetical protein